MATRQLCHTAGVDGVSADQLWVNGSQQGQVAATLSLHAGRAFVLGLLPALPPLPFTPAPRAKSIEIALLVELLIELAVTARQGRVGRQGPRRGHIAFGPDLGQRPLVCLNRDQPL